MFLPAVVVGIIPQNKSSVGTAPNFSIVLKLESFRGHFSPQIMQVYIYWERKVAGIRLWTFTNEERNFFLIFPKKLESSQKLDSSKELSKNIISKLRLRQKNIDRPDIKRERRRHCLQVKQPP